MSDTRRCPDCGHQNAAGAETCEACGFPLGAPAAAGPAARPSGESPAPGPWRSRRRALPPRANHPALTLWLIFGTIMALVVLYVGIKANVERAMPPIEGSSQAQQMRADSLIRSIEQDSANVQARVRLGDILYDTGNWSDAIVQYRAAVRMDSSLATALVDLGVCYYNLGHTDDAERHFRLALRRDPHQPVALYNLGIVQERRGDHKSALEYFHRALHTDPPDEMKQAVIEAMSRVQEKAGMTPPPLTGGGG